MADIEPAATWLCTENCRTLTVLNTERIEIRVTRAQKSEIERAAAISGRTVSTSRLPSSPVRPVHATSDPAKRFSGGYGFTAFTDSIRTIYLLISDAEESITQTV